METIKISEKNARAALEKADANFKPVLAELFGLQLSPTKWQDIKSFDHAAMVCPPDEFEAAVLKLTPVTDNSESIQAFTKLSIISRAMNKLNNNGEIWEPDWSDDDEYKYYLWLQFKAGSGFSDCGYRCVYTCTSVGSRLCFITEAMAKHAFEHFKGLYNDLFTL